MAAEDDIEVFRCGDELAARTAVDEVLAPLGIKAHIHNRSTPMFPAPATEGASIFVAVRESRRRQAIEALAAAVADGALDGEVATL